MYAQTVNGTVTSSDGPMPGATVQVKGTNTGTTTDFDGNFSIAAGADDVLIVSFVGYSTQEVAVGGQDQITIILEADNALEEVVVVGYETVYKSEVIGAVTQLKGREVQNMPAPSVETAFQGKLAGVQVQQNSGQPGSAVQVRVRGYSSIGAGSEPLYVIDGVPIKSGSFGSLAIGPDRYDGNVGTNALTDLNPNDIASIEVLKDASEAAIYGARASNGVVLITTKRGRKGPARFNVDMYTGVQQITNTLPLLNKQEFLQVSEEMVRNRLAIFNPGASCCTREQLVYTGLPQFQDGDTDWQEELFRNAAVSNLNFSAVGGNEAVSYAASLGYFSQDGIVINTGYERVSSRLNLDVKASDKFKFGVNMSYSLSYRDGTDEGPRQNGVLYRGLRTVPTLQLRDTQGELQAGRPFTPNPVKVAEESIFDTRTNRTVVNVFGEYEFFKGLSLRSNFAGDILSLRQDNFYPGTLAFSNNRESAASHSQDIGWVNENVLRYRKTIDDTHTISALAGVSFQRNRTELLIARANNAPSDAVTTVNAGASLLQATSNITSNSISSYFGKLKYNYKGRYLISGSVRVDGSSRFGSGNKYGTFPAFSAGWNVSKETFWGEGGFVDDLKVRASWGQTGNQNIDNFVAQGLLNPGSNYAGVAGISTAPNGLPNTGLTWETTTQTNIGADLTLFGGRMSVAADYWTKDTEDLLFQVALPKATGYESYVTNIGEVQNKGIDFQMGTTVIDKGDFRWTTDFNISFLKNEVKKLPGGNDIQQSERYLFGSVLSILREGESLGSFYLYQQNGVFSTSAEAANAGYVDQISSINGGVPQAGDARWADINGDGVINVQDKYIAGNPIPDFTGGFNNQITYKGLSLQAFFQYSKGNDIFNLFRSDLRRGYSTNYLKENLLAWKQEGDVTDVPRNVQLDPARNHNSYSRPSDAFLEDGSFLRLRTLTLAYQLPSEWVGKLGFRNFRIYATGTNLLTLTDYSGFDPEVNIAQVNNANQNGGFQFGIDRGLYPMNKSYTLGVSVDF